VIRVAIVGAGPAGIAAAGVLVAHGAAVTVVDEESSRIRAPASGRSRTLS